MIVIFLLFYSEFDNCKCYTGLSIMKCIPMGIKFEQKKMFQPTPAKVNTLLEFILAIISIADINF